MKRLLMLLVLALALVTSLSFAQEPAAAGRPAPEPATSQVSLNAPISFADSVDYYDQLADELEESATEGKKAGFGMIGVGMAATGIGALLIYDLASGISEYEDRSGELTGEGWLLLIPGLVLAVGGGTLAVVGSFKIAFAFSDGSQASKYRVKAYEFREKEEKAQLSIVPVVNPLKGSMGARLALNI